MITDKGPMQPLRTMVSYSLASFGINMVNSFSNFALPLYLGAYGLPAAVVGLLAQERSSMGGIEQPIIGMISDHVKSRWGRRRPFFIIGSLLVALSLVFLSTHPPIWAVVLNLTLFASFLAVAADPYQALMADLFPSEQRGRVGAAVGIANMAGQVTFSLLSLFLWERNQDLAFYLVAVGVVGGFVITFLGIREPEITTEPAKWTARYISRHLRELPQHREFAKYSLSQFFYWLGVGGAVPFLTRFGVFVLGLSEGEAIGLTMVLVLSTFVFAAPAGILGDRLGKKRVLSWGLLCFAVFAIVGSQAQTVMQGAVMMGLIGLANAMTTILSYPLYTDLMPRHRVGEFTGFSALVTSMAQALGAVLVGIFVDFTGNYRAVFLVTGVLIGVSLLLLQRVRPEEALPKEPKEEAEYPETPLEIGEPTAL